MLRPLLQIKLWLLDRLRRFVGGPRRAHFHPGRQIIDLPLRELLLRRHLKVGVAVADRLNHQTFRRLARNDRQLARFAAFERQLFRIKSKPAF